jgi:hypothetical protein
MYIRDYQLAKRFIKRNWDSKSAEEQVELAKSMGGIRHFRAFMGLMGSVTSDITDHEITSIGLELGDEAQNLEPIQGLILRKRGMV